MPLLSAEPRTPSRAFATPGLLVAQVGRAATRRYKAALSPIGLKPRPTAALMQLRREGPISQQSLAESLDIDPANLVAVLNQLEHEGLATRRRDPADRRRHVVEITKRGVKRQTKSSGRSPKWRRHFSQRLTPTSASSFSSYWPASAPELIGFSRS